MTNNPTTGPVKPNFMIVGAAKAGTSSLWHWLGQHPEVFLPGDKEPGYFAAGYGIKDLPAYLALFEAGRGRRCVGEATAAYLAAPESAQWIFDTLGRIKIIILLRNPVQRAYSLYCWMVMEGYEPLPSFEGAMAQEAPRMASEQFRRECPQYFFDYLYFHTGLYAEQVERYTAIFGADSVKVCLFDDLVADPARLYAEICGFLGISSGDRPAFEAQNASVIPRSIALQSRLRTLRHRTERLLGGFGRPIFYFCDAVMKMNTARGRKVPMPAAVRQALAERYRPDVTRLSRLIGRDLSHWLKP